MSESYCKTPFSCTRDGLRIAGEFYTPANGTAPYPTVILSHGFRDDMDGTRPVAVGLAEHGIAVCIFDFIGGGWNSKSDGDMQHMSVLTEAADLETVLLEVQKRPEADKARLFLMGESQGGFVSTYAAARHPEVRGLIAFYPAYVLQEDARRRVSAPGYKPGSGEIMGVRLGEIYDTDALSFDIYDIMRTYEKPVLLLHGTADGIVPLAWSERAAKTFPHARLITIPGAGHGFAGEEERIAVEATAAFIREQEMADK